MIDNVNMTGGEFNAGCRGTSGTVPHGLTTYDSVFWNHQGTVNVNRQSDAVWLVGTEYVRNHNSEYYFNNEGEGQGETLYPQSLYVNQLERRLAGKVGTNISLE